MQCTYSLFALDQVVSATGQELRIILTLLEMLGDGRLFIRLTSDGNPPLWNMDLVTACDVVPL
jgi:hypothetical protein